MTLLVYPFDGCDATGCALCLIDNGRRGLLHPCVADRCEDVPVELTERCGLHRTFIGSVERVQKNISLLNLRLIAGKLRVKLSALLPEGKLPPGS